MNTTLGATDELPAPRVEGNTTGKAKNKNSKSPKGKKKRVQDGRPKHPLSAYNLFFQREREVLLASLPVRAEGKPRRSHGKIGFADMAREIGKRWKAINPEDKAYFDELARLEKERYHRELEIFKVTRKLQDVSVATTRPVVSQQVGASPGSRRHPEHPTVQQQRDWQAPPVTIEPEPFFWEPPTAAWQNREAAVLSVPHGAYSSAMVPITQAVFHPVSPIAEDEDFEPLPYEPQHDVTGPPSMYRRAHQLDESTMDSVLRIFQ